jgi:hypothetical protein
LNVTELSRERRVSGRKTLGARHHHAELHLRCGTNEGGVAEGIGRTCAVGTGGNIKGAPEVIQRVGELLSETEIGNAKTGDATVRTDIGITISERP